MKIGIIGGGSVGLLISAYLSKKHDITLYVRRQEQVQKIDAHGIILGHAEDSFAVNVCCINELNQEDCLIVCVKQPHLTSVLPHILQLKKHIPIIFLQNGMGHIDQLTNFRQPIYLGVVEHGTLKNNDYTVIHTGKGSIKLAVFRGTKPQLNEIINSIHQSEFPVYYVDNWEELLHEKLVVNAVINPLTAIFGVSNGEIVDNPYIRKLARTLCIETAGVLGLDVEVAWELVNKIVKNTQKNVSSMLKDIKENLKTENDAISGYIMKHSDQDVPYTTFVYNAVKAIEFKKGYMD